MGVPGWPDFACCTASIESVRIVLIDSWSSCTLVMGSPCASSDVAFGVQSGHLAQTSHVTLGVTELGGDERLDEIPGHRRTHRPPAHAEDVHVVILDSLAGRKVVVNQAGAD